MDTRYTDVMKRGSRPTLLLAVSGLLLCSCLAQAAPAGGFVGLAATSPLATATTWQVSSNSSNEVTVLQNFNFGTLVISGPGTVRISPEGVLTTTGGVNSAGGFPQAAKLRLNSHPGNTYTLDLPPSVTLTNAGGGTMLLRNFTFNPAAVGSMHDSKQDVAVGATLQVSSNQAGGAYRGNIDVVVSYD